MPIKLCPLMYAVGPCLLVLGSPVQPGDHAGPVRLDDGVLIYELEK